MKTGHRAGSSGGALPEAVHACDPLFAGFGEMRALCRTFDWAATGLGAVADWPQSLRTAVDLCLGSPSPTFVGWGPNLVQVYNDAALAILRSKHPKALGAPAHEVWADVWPVIGRQIEGVLATGEPARGGDVSIVPDRGGALEPAWFTFSYGAAHDERGKVAGVFCTALETTARVCAEAGLRESAASFSTTADLVPDLLWRSEPNGETPWHNARWLDYTGQTVSEGAGWGWAAAIHPDDRRSAAERDALTRQLATAEAGERRRLALELHDGAGQHLAALGLELQALANRSPANSDAERSALRLRSLTNALGEELHSLAVRLRPTALDDFGLEAALSVYVDQWARQSGAEIDLRVRVGDARLGEAMETAIYRFVQEALTNVLRHGAAAWASVLVEAHDGTVVAVVEDDGAGFDVDALEPEGDAMQYPSRLGLRGMRARADLLGGTLDVESAPGEGTTVFMRLPLTMQHRTKVARTAG